MELLVGHEQASRLAWPSSPSPIERAHLTPQFAIVGLARKFAMVVVKSVLSLRRKASNARPTPTLKSSKVSFSGAGEDPRSRSSCSHLPADHAASAAKGKVLLEDALEALKPST